jgi:hypothetical protein
MYRGRFKKMDAVPEGIVRLIRGASSGDGADGQMIWIDSAGRLQSL